MQTVDETLSLLQRQVELETAMRQPGGIRITEEQQLHHLRQQLKQFPETVQAVMQASHALRRPVTDLTATEGERWANSAAVA